MKKFTLFAVAMLFSAVSFAALNPFAYALSSHLSPDQKTLTVNYSLNADATSVKIIIGEDAKEVECTGSNLTKGSHAVEISTEGIPTASPQSWRVVVEGNSVSAPTLQDTQFSFCLPRGVDVDNSPESPYFGRIYATEATDGGNAYHSKEGKGLYAFDPTLTPIQNATGGYVFTGGITYGTDDISRVVVAGDGRVFVSRFTPTEVSPVVEVNPADLNEDFKDLFTTIKGKTIGIDVKGAGEDLQLVMLSTDERIITEYDLGTATTWTETTPSRTYVKKDLTTEKSLSLVTDNAYISYDLNDGIWLTQHRATATTTEPTIAHVIASGVDYNNFNEGIEHNGTSNGGIAISPDGSLLAVVGAGTKKLTIYAVSRDGSGKITLTSQYTIATSGSNHTALSWDYAGNLYVTNRSAETLTFYAMPYGGTVSTPCAAKYAFTLQEGGVEGTFYDVTVNCEAEQGQVTGNDGTYLEGSTVTLTATANRGYKFLNWTVGETTYTENPLTLTVNSNLSVTANFEALTPLTVTAVANDEALGTVTGSGAYFEGENVTLTATPNAGCEFVKWSNEATDATITIPAQDITLTAIFQKISYTVTLLTNDAAKGTVTGAGSYTAGEEVSLSAVPAEGYKLLYWSDRVAEAERTITVSGNVALSAYFVKDYTSVSYTVEKVWENTNVPAATTNGYQAVGWDGKIYMQDAGNKKIVTYSSADDLGTDYATAGGAGQQIAVDEAGNLIVFNATFYSATPNAILIYQKGSTEGKAVSFTLPQPGRCDFFAASGDIYSAEGGYVYFYCQNTTVVNRLKIANGAATEADVTVDVVGQEITAGNSQNHVMVDIFGNLVAVSRSNAASWINVYTNESSKTFAATLSGIKLSTLGGCSFELGGKELWAYNVGSTAYNSEWNIYNLTDEEFLSETALYANNTTSVNSAANWLNVQVVDEKTAYIYQFCPKVAAAVWKVTCTTQEPGGSTTAVENTVVAPQTQKVLRNGQVLIIRDGKTYNMMGQEIR